MRETRLFQVYDTEARQAMGPIMAARIPAPIVREFKAILADKRTEPGKYPEHFELREIGTQDEETLRLSPMDPTTIYSGKQWVFDQERKEAQAVMPHATNGV